MNSKERVDEFLKLQKKGSSLEEVADILNVKPATLRRDLNKLGYKSIKGKYEKIDDKNIQKSEQLTLDVNAIDKKIEEKSLKKAENKSLKNTENKSLKKVEEKSLKKTEDKPLDKKTTSKKNKVLQPKRDRKINITQEDLDKLCEVYDWYLEVRDMKALKKKKVKKEVQIDFIPTEYKSVSLKVDKAIWEDFLRLCSNSGLDRKELVTQALNEFMKVHKDLL